MSGQDGIAQLAFWARNMTAVSDGGMKWPGFSYTDAEWTRLRALAQAVPAAAFGKFITWTTVIFLAVAAAGIVGVFVPLLMLLFPDPAKMAGWQFACLLAACALSDPCARPCAGNEPRRALVGRRCDARAASRHGR